MIVLSGTHSSRTPDFTTPIYAPIFAPIYAPWLSENLTDKSGQIVFNFTCPRQENHPSKHISLHDEYVELYKQ